MTIETAEFGDFYNTGTISSDSLNIIVTDGFTTSATSFNAFSFRNLAITTEGGFDNSTPLDLDNLTIKTGVSFRQSGVNITADNINITTGENFNNNSSITVGSLTATVGNYFNNNGNINAASFTATVAETFGTFNGSVINTASLNVTAKNFNTYTGSTVNAATLTIEVANFVDNIDNAGIVSSDSLNFILTADFAPIPAILLLVLLTLVI